nr:putative reverse transcriptase domain-containing protein [Tanacetum cinerariifolium]
MNMTLHSSTKDKILAAQEEASDELAEIQRGMDELMERRSDRALYYLDQRWFPLKGNVRTLIMVEAHKSKYSVHPGADKMYYDLRDRYWWSGMKNDIAVYGKRLEWIMAREEVVTLLLLLPPLTNHPPLILMMMMMMMEMAKEPRVPSNPQPLQSHPSLDITLSLSPFTPLNHIHDTPSPPSPPQPQPPIIGYPLYYNYHDYH